MPSGYQHLGRRQRAAIVALVAIAIFNVASQVSLIGEIRLLDRIIAGENVPDSEITASDTRSVIFSAVQFLLYVAAAVFFIRWFHRAYKNVDTLAEPRRHGTGWAIGGWFVPFLALWRPKQVLNDIWWGTAPGGRRHEGSNALLVVWWLGFVVTEFLGNLAFRSGLRAETPGAIRASHQTYLASDTLDITVAILAILVVLRVTERMESRALEIASPSLEPDAQAPVAGA